MCWVHYGRYIRGEDDTANESGSPRRKNHHDEEVNLVDDIGYAISDSCTFHEPKHSSYVIFIHQVLGNGKPLQCQWEHSELFRDKIALAVRRIPNPNQLKRIERLYRALTSSGLYGECRDLVKFLGSLTRFFGFFFSCSPDSSGIPPAFEAISSVISYL